MTHESAEAAIVYDFEGLAATSSASIGHPVSLTSLQLTTSGLTMSLTRQSGVAFDIVDATSYGGAFPAGFGTRSLDPFSNQSSATAFVANFSSTISSFSLQYGDFGSDSDVGTIMAYAGQNGTGALLASATDTYGLASFPAFDTFGVSATGIGSVVFIAGSPSFQNSVYYDNITVTPSVAAVPEPASLILTSIAGAIALARRRSTRRAG